MPKLLETVRVALDWTDIDRRRAKKRIAGPERSNGIHLSGIIKAVLDLKPVDLADEMPLRMAVGMAWEDWAVGLWSGLKWQPGEQCVDGIYGSPDGLSYMPIAGKQTGVVEEFKATWKSRSHDILAERLWIWQVAGYCKMLDLLHARLHVLWVNGNYRPPNPEYMVYLIEFTTEEIERLWLNVFLKNKHLAQAEVH